MSRPAWVAALWLLVFFALAPASARAQPTAAERALATAYEADTLFARGKWAEAYDRFKLADDLAHSPVFVLYMARSRRNAGKLVEASAIYERVAAEKLAPDAAKPFKTAIADAVAELAELKTKTPSVRVEVRGLPAKGGDVRVDGQTIATGVVVPLDPGAHVFVASGPDKKAEKNVTLLEGQTEALVELDLTSETTTPGNVEEPGPLAPGIVVLTVGGLGVALGAIAGGIALSLAGDVKEGCVDNHCLTEDADDLDTTRTLATVSTVGFVAGGALVATGIVLLVVRPGGSSGPAVALSPSGIRLFGAF